MAKKPVAKPSGAGGFYRLLRDWHGYLSAASFIALLFFAATGILLNHPGLLSGEGKPLVEKTLTLSPDQIAKVKAAKEPGRALSEIVAETETLSGDYQNGEMSGADVFVRMQGAKGSTDLRGNIETGLTTVTVERLTAVEVLNGLHRGELAGAAWRFWIDVIGGLLIVMSILGYILFFSLRFRIRTALIVTGLSLALMIGLFVVLVP